MAAVGTITVCRPPVRLGRRTGGGGPRGAGMGSPRPHLSQGAVGPALGLGVRRGGAGAGGRAVRPPRAVGGTGGAVSKDTLYRLLDIESGAELGEIKIAYRKMAKKYHPDVCKDVNARERFMEVQEAYEILSDPFMKKMYDTTDRLEEIVEEWEEKVRARKAAMEAEKKMEEEALERKERMERKMSMAINCLLIAWPLSYVAAAAVHVGQFKAGLAPIQVCARFMINNCN